MLALEELQALVGTELPGGSYTIEPYRHWLMADAVGAEPTRSGVADPMEAFHAAIGGKGLSWDGLFALVGASAEDGPLLGGAELELHRPLEVGATYAVRARVEAAERKQGRRAGVFDVVTFRFELVAADGAPAAATTTQFLFPRRDA